MSERRPSHSSVPQAEAPVRTPSAPEPDVFPHTSPAAAPTPHQGAAATLLRRREALAAVAVGVVIALAGTVPAAATAAVGEEPPLPADGPLVVVLLVILAIIVGVAAFHGQPRARRKVETSCCLVEHGPVEDDETPAHEGKR